MERIFTVKNSAELVTTTFHAYIGLGVTALSVDNLSWENGSVGELSTTQHGDLNRNSQSGQSNGVPMHMCNPSMGDPNAEWPV